MEPTLTVLLPASSSKYRETVQQYYRCADYVIIIIIVYRWMAGRWNGRSQDAHWMWFYLFIRLLHIDNNNNTNGNSLTLLSWISISCLALSCCLSLLTWVIFIITVFVVGFKESESTLLLQNIVIPEREIDTTLHCTGCELSTQQFNRGWVDDDGCGTTKV